MNDKIAVSIKNLNKTYKIYSSPGQRFMSLLFKKNLGKDFIALNDISLDIYRGEAFAIIGKNGSGKSTLLQILAGILKPTTGEIKVNGRIAALLELGSGFNPESTGYENIYMNAAILGLEKHEIEKKVQDIIDFADIGEHLYEPVKTYSSGMYVRLGFAVAINVDADILLVDEALAVGDVFFRQKCYTRLNELKARGTTIILVTHNMGEVEQFCDRAMLLNQSKKFATGNSRDIVKQYYILNDKNNTDKELSLLKKGDDYREEEAICFKNGWKMKECCFYDLKKCIQISDGKANCISVGLFDRDGKLQRTFQQGEKAYFYCEWELLADICIPNLGVMIRNQMGNLIHGKDTLQMGIKLPESVPAGKHIHFLQAVDLDIEIGEYTIDIGFGSITKEDYSVIGVLSQEELNGKIEHICDLNNIGTFNVILKNRGNPTRMGFYGNCGLESNGWIEIGGNHENV